jgi:hypothetical protein
MSLHPSEKCFCQWDKKGECYGKCYGNLERGGAYSVGQWIELYGNLLKVHGYKCYEIEEDDKDAKVIKDGIETLYNRRDFARFVEKTLEFEKWIGSRI